MALNLYGRANRFTRADFVEAAARLGIRERATGRMIDSIVDAARDWPDRCGEIGFPTRQTDRFADTLRSRIATLSELGCHAGISSTAYAPCPHTSDRRATLSREGGQYNIPIIPRFRRYRVDPSLRVS
jgi:hypothetical protein